MRRKDFIGKDNPVACCEECIVDSCCSEVCDKFRSFMKDRYIKKILTIDIDCIEPSMSIQLGWFTINLDNDELDITKKETVKIKGDELVQIMNNKIDINDPKIIDAIGGSMTKILQIKGFYKGEK